jgi:hypothetical protein
MKKTIWILFVFLLFSCALPKQYIIIQTVGDAENGYQCYHVESLNGRDIDVVRLPSNFTEGDIKWIRIKTY